MDFLSHYTALKIRLKAYLHMTIYYHDRNVNRVNNYNSTS